MSAAEGFCLSAAGMFYDEKLITDMQMTFDRLPDCGRLKLIFADNTEH